MVSMIISQKLSSLIFLKKGRSMIQDEGSAFIFQCMTSLTFRDYFSYKKYVIIIYFIEIWCFIICYFKYDLNIFVFVVKIY